MSNQESTRKMMWVVVGCTSLALVLNLVEWKSTPLHVFALVMDVAAIVILLAYLRITAPRSQS